MGGTQYFWKVGAAERERLRARGSKLSPLPCASSLEGEYAMVSVPGNPCDRREAWLGARERVSVEGE